MTSLMQLDEWTEKNCLDLIEEFEKRRMLWDPSDHFYYKKGVKPQAWQEIGDALGIPAKAAKHKMIVLMSSFRREKSKILQSIREAESKPDPSSVKLYKSAWFAFKKMSFLMDKPKKSKHHNKYQDVEQDSEENDESRTLKETLLEHFIDRPSSDTNAKKKAKLTNSPPEDLETDLDLTTEVPEDVTVLFDDYNHEDDLMSSVKLKNSRPERARLPAIRNDFDDDDDIRAFTNFIASKMRKYSEAKKNAVQQEICDIIFRADGNTRKRKRSVSISDLHNPGADEEMFVTKTEIFD